MGDAKDRILEFFSSIGIAARAWHLPDRCPATEMHASFLLFYPEIDGY